jgi:hypothetical protein
VERFKSTLELQKTIHKLLISARVKAALMAIKPDSEVVTNDGSISVKVKATEFEEEKELHYKIEAIAKSVSWVTNVEGYLEPYGL